MHLHVAASMRLSKTVRGLQRNQAWGRGSCSSQRTVGKIDFGVQGSVKKTLSDGQKQ